MNRNHIIMSFLIFIFQKKYKFFLIPALCLQVTLCSAQDCELLIQSIKYVQKNDHIRFIKTIREIEKRGNANKYLKINNHHSKKIVNRKSSTQPSPIKNAVLYCLPIGIISPPTVIVVAV